VCNLILGKYGGLPQTSELFHFGRRLGLAKFKNFISGFL
jgi:hypothetical protein